MLMLVIAGFMLQHRLLLDIYLHEVFGYGLDSASRAEILIPLFFNLKSKIKYIYKVILCENFSIFPWKLNFKKISNFFK